MGRYYWNKRANVDDYKQFSTSFLVRHGYLKTGISHRSGTISWLTNGQQTGGMSFSVSKDDAARVGMVRVRFAQTNRKTGESKDFDYEIKLV